MSTNDPNNGKLPGSSNHQDRRVPLPRTKRKRKSKSKDRGLPSQTELIDLARSYLEIQHELFPNLVESGVLPPITDETLATMAKDYVQSHQDGCLSEHVIEFLNSLELLLGLFYGRFSCDGSNPTSIIDQMSGSLALAHEQDRFIPWSLVFADFSISGLTKDRPGYSTAKDLIESDLVSFEAMYIDDFTRASRDALEWWSLAHACKCNRKQLYGASDNFDLSDPMSDVWITIYGLLSRLFIKGLREKVSRGMKGAAKRGTVLGRLAMVFTRIQAEDENGNPKIDSNGDPIYTRCKDLDGVAIAQRALAMLLDDNLSPYKIARVFNQEKVDDWNGWTESTIKKLLTSPKMIGVFIWNQFRTERDIVTNKAKRVRNPRSEWIVQYDKDLAVFETKRWAAARKRLAKRVKKSNGKREASRNQVSASTLFSGTLECAYCGKELTLSRSAGKYKNMHCQNGLASLHGCELTTSKSVRIIETALLKAISEKILTASYLEKMVNMANRFMESEQAKPRKDVGPLRKRCRELDTKIDKLVKLVEDEPDDDLCGGYHRRIKNLGKDKCQLLREIADAESQNEVPNGSLGASTPEGHLSDIRGLLNGDVKKAAVAIRELTGPIKIRQEPHENGSSHGARWIATLSPNLVKILQAVSEEDCPDSVILEYLSNANWTMGDSVEIVIDENANYVSQGPIFLEQHDGGKSIEQISREGGVTWQVACETIAYAATGLIPNLDDRDNPARVAGWDRFKEVAALVAELRDNKKVEWSRIVGVVAENAGFSVSINTVLRAYEFAHNRPHGRRGLMNYRSRFGNAKFEQFRELYEGGLTNMAELARRIGCAPSTTRRWRNRLRHS